MRKYFVSETLGKCKRLYEKTACVVFAGIIVLTLLALLMNVCIVWNVKKLWIMPLVFISIPLLIVWDFSVLFLFLVLAVYGIMLCIRRIQKMKEERSIYENQ